MSLGVKAEAVRIAAASSLQFALNDVIESYVSQTARTAPQVVYGSSGNLYRQILQGAPFELFYSARGELTQQLFDEGASVDAGDLFGTGRLVLSSANSVEVKESLADFIRSRVLAKNKKLAIANPAHAPYGRAAKETLQSLQVWDEVQENLVNGEQVSQAARFVVSGASSYGLVSLSLALSSPIADVTYFQLIDDTLHEPIYHRVVRLKAAGADAEHFYQFVLNSKEAHEILSRYGLK